jgi:hypothetical protein
MAMSWSSSLPTMAGPWICRLSKPGCEHAQCGDPLRGSSAGSFRYGQVSERWDIEGLNDGCCWFRVPLQLDAIDVEPDPCSGTVSMILDGGVKAPLRSCSFDPFVFTRHRLSPGMLQALDQGGSSLVINQQTSQLAVFIALIVDAVCRWNQRVVLEHELNHRPAGSRWVR